MKNISAVYHDGFGVIAALHVDVPGILLFYPPYTDLSLSQSMRMISVVRPNVSGTFSISISIHGFIYKI